MIPLIWNVQNRYRQIDRTQIGDFQGLGPGIGGGWEEWGATVNGYGIPFWGDENTLELDCDNGYMNILKVLELHTSKYKLIKLNN